MKIGLFGGTFDPVHDEHVKIVTTAIAELNLDKVIVLPVYVSPFKDRADTSSEEDRLNMVRLAFDGIERVEVSDYEIKKAAVSYTSETVTYFKKLYKKDDLYFIMGEDSLKTFRKWNRPDVIVKNAEIVVCGRYGSYVDFDAEQNYFDLHYGKKFIKTDYEGSSVSSTKVRTYSRLNIPLGGMVPEKVGKYIKEKNLYGVNDYAEYLVGSYRKETYPHRKRCYRRAYKRKRIKARSRKSRTCGNASRPCEVSRSRKLQKLQIQRNSAAGRTRVSRRVSCRNRTRNYGQGRSGRDKISHDRKGRHDGPSEAYFYCGHD